MTWDAYPNVEMLLFERGAKMLEVVVCNFVSNNKYFKTTNSRMRYEKYVQVPGTILDFLAAHFIFNLIYQLDRAL